MFLFSSWLQIERCLNYIWFTELMFYIRLWNQYWSGHDIIIIYFLLRNFAHVFSARVIMLFLSPRPTQCPVQASNNRNQRGERSQIGNCYISDPISSTIEQCKHQSCSNLLQIYLLCSRYAVDIYCKSLLSSVSATHHPPGIQTQVARVKVESYRKI